MLTVTDALGSITTLQYDSLNRMTRSTDALTNQTQYTYNSHDAVLTVTDPRSKVTSYTYDGFGEMIQEVSPDRGTTVLMFDSDGNVSQQTDANGFVTNMTYDALDRILTRTYPADSALNVAFTYDQAGHGAGIGRLTTGTDQTGSFSRNYDERGLMTLDARTLAGNAYTTGFSYQSAGRVSAITYASSGWTVGYGYDAAGQISAVVDKPPSLSAVNIATSITHMPFGPVKSLTWANGITGTWVYDLDYRASGIRANDGATNIYYSSYGYNGNDSITSILDNVTPANNQTLQYNSADWLNFASGSYGTGINLTYDSTGNRTAFGGTSYTISSSGNRMTVANGSSITFTSSGNITAIGASPTFTYNKANQMATAVVSGTTSTYGYDAFGMRLRAQVGTTPVRILTYGFGGEVLTETSSGTKYDYIYLDGSPIAVLAPGTSTVSYIHTDYLGTPQKATSAAKAVVWNGAYNPNGVVTPTTSINMNLRFAGQIQDPTGFYHNGFRDYIPATAQGGGRYIQADPIGLEGGINPYIYVENNTFKFIDPEGLDDPDVINDRLGLPPLMTGGSGRSILKPTTESRTSTTSSAQTLAKEGVAKQSTPRAFKDICEDPKLNNIRNDLYKGTNAPNQIGSGSTADAIRNELKTGQSTYGKYHSEKGRQYVKALDNWLAKNPNASAADKATAKSLRDDLNSALSGK